MGIRCNEAFLTEFLQQCPALNPMARGEQERACKKAYRAYAEAQWWFLPEVSETFVQTFLTTDGRQASRAAFGHYLSGRPDLCTPPSRFSSYSRSVLGGIKETLAALVRRGSNAMGVDQATFQRVMVGSAIFTGVLGMGLGLYATGLLPALLPRQGLGSAWRGLTLALKRVPSR